MEFPLSFPHAKYQKIKIQEPNFPGLERKNKLPSNPFSSHKQSPNSSKFDPLMTPTVLLKGKHAFPFIHVYVLRRGNHFSLI